MRAWLVADGVAASHQGFPVLDGKRLLGVLTRRDLVDDKVDPGATIRALVKRAPVVVSDAASLREAADQMVRAGVGRLPVVHEGDAGTVVGIVTRSDVLGAHEERLASNVVPHRTKHRDAA